MLLLVQLPYLQNDVDFCLYYLFLQVINVFGETVELQISLVSAAELILQPLQADTLHEAHK